MRCRSVLAAVAALLVAFAQPALASITLYGLGNTNVFQNTPSSLYTINTTTGAATLVGNTGLQLRALAYNPLSGKAYASQSQRSGGGGLYEINLTTGAATFIGGTTSFAVMEFDASGNLFGYDSRGDGYNYYSINVNTGVGSLINNFALNQGAYALFDMTFSSADNAMLFYQQWFPGRGGEGLSTVNTADGTVTPVVTGSYQPYRPDIAADDSGNVFAIDRGVNDAGTNVGLYSLNKGTANTTLIGLSGVGLQSIAFTSDVDGVVPEPATLIVWGGIGLLGAVTAFRQRKQLQAV